MNVTVMRLTVLVAGESVPQFTRVTRIGVDSGVQTTNGKPLSQMLDVVDGIVESSVSFAEYAAGRP